jgi:hypothetical protein
MAHQSEFPNFRDMPEIPHQWIDVSCRNDFGPSFRVIGNDSACVEVWIGETDPAKRNWPDSPRFAIMLHDQGRTLYLMESDSWNDVLQFLGVK